MQSAILTPWTMVSAKIHCLHQALRRQLLLLVGQVFHGWTSCKTLSFRAFKSTQILHIDLTVLTSEKTPTILASAPSHAEPVHIDLTPSSSKKTPTVSPEGFGPGPCTPLL